MRRLMMAVGCACAAGVVGLSAAQDHKMDKGRMDKDMPMTVTGCVAQSSDMSHFMLTNAMMSGGMHGDMKGDMKAMTYDLMGGELKAHVGHKVEVTGMMSHAKMSKDKKSKDKMDHDKMAMGDKHGALTVKSVKMLSSTCP